MERMELDNHSNNTLFEEIKDKCKSRTKVNIYSGLAVILFLILMIILGINYNQGIHNLRHIQIVSTVILVCLSLVVVWLILNNFRFLRKVDGLDTPEQLLYWYKKKITNERLLYFISVCALLCDQIYSSFSYCREDPTFLIVSLPLAIAVIAFISAYWYRGLKDETFKFYRKDVEILEQLQELTEKK